MSRKDNQPMATLDARASLKTFQMTDGTQVDFDSALTFNLATEYSWVTSESHHVQALGSGITTDASSHKPTAGTATTIKFDLGGDGDFATNSQIDAVLTLDPGVDLADLIVSPSTNKFASADAFWEQVLSGNDRIYAPNSGSGFMTGDFVQIVSTIFTSESKTGGNDTISAAANSGGGISLGIGTRSTPKGLAGDAYLVAGAVNHDIAFFAHLTGGDDLIVVTKVPAFSLVGDAMLVEEAGEVTGGNDTITSNTTLNTISLGISPAMAGDALQNGGVVQGGDDHITGSNNFYIDDFIAGDVWLQTSGTTGGDDILAGRAGHDFIAGDVAILAGNLVGGDDRIGGGSDSDLLAGDVLQAGTGGFFGTIGMSLTVTADVKSGDDTIAGGEGNDTIAGDVYQLVNLATGSTIRCGSDILAGGDGDDVIYGDVMRGPRSLVLNGGNDLISGGNGDDLLFGGGGGDTMDGGAGIDQLTGSKGADIFSFTSTSHSGPTAATRDTIMDFTHGVDKIDVSAIDAREATAIDNNFAFIGSDAFTAAGQIRAVQSGDDTILLFNTSGASGAEMSIRLFDFTASTLTPGDFVL